jgi:hypothetical protein
MKELLNAADCLAKVRRKLRFGDCSREPLRLLRLEWKEDWVECDWLMRSADPWDADLPAHLVEEHQTLQALRDALRLRDIVFDSFPTVSSAELRMFRTASEQCPELMMTGTVHRTNESYSRVASVVMRAMLCGFRFTLSGGVLARMTPAPIGCS